MSESFSRRMRAYEQALPYKANGEQPCILRLDGRAFHTFTDGLPDPFDERISELMQATAAYLVHITHALCAYTHTDEISLILFARHPREELYFGGKIQKLISITAAEATLYFHQFKQTLTLPEKQQQHNMHFDCRFFQVPTPSEALNYLLWREQDALRNSVAKLARQHFPLSELHHKNSKALKSLLQSKGIDWQQLSPYHQRGVILQTQHHLNRNTVRPLSLPPLHSLYSLSELEQLIF